MPGKMKLINIPVNVVRIAKQHWKRHHADEEVQRIASEIESVGLIHPITIRVVDTRPELLAGMKRFIAYRDLLKLGEIPAIVVEATDAQAELLSLYENLGQSGLTADEIDHANARAVALEAAKSGGKPRQVVIDAVAQRTRQKPLEVKHSIQRDEILIPAAKKALKEGKISKSQATELTKVNRPTQETVLKEMLEEGTSYRKIRDKRIATKGAKSKDDSANITVRMATRHLLRCVGAAMTLKRELAEFNTYIVDHDVRFQKLGGVKAKDSEVLNDVAEKLAATKKLLRR